MTAIIVSNEKTYPVNVRFLGSDTHPTHADGRANLIQERAAGHLVNPLFAVFINSIIRSFHSAMRIFLSHRSEGVLDFKEGFLNNHI